MKKSSFLLSSAALPLMLLASPASADLQSKAASLVIAQGGPAPEEELRRRERPGRQDRGEAGPGERRREGREDRPGRPDRPAAQEQDRGGREERGPRPGRDVGPAAGEEAPDRPRRPREMRQDEAPERARPRREPGPPQERPSPPSGTIPAQPARPAQGPAERARPQEETPERSPRPGAREGERRRDRERSEDAPRQDRPRQQAPDAPPTRQSPAEPAQPAQPATPPAPAQQRPTTDAPRPTEGERPDRPRGQRPSQEQRDTPAATPPAPAPSAAPPPAPAPTPAPTPTPPPAPTPAAPPAPSAQPTPPAPTAAPTRGTTDIREQQPLDPSRVRLEDLRNQRRQRTEEGGRRVIIEEPGNRTIVREGGRVIIRHDETERFRRIYGADDVRVERRGPDEVVTVVRRPDGSEIISVRDEYGNLIRRIRREPAGREVVLIENRRGDRRRGGGGYFVEEIVELPPPAVRIPREEYIVEVEDASQEEIYEAFTAPPVERLARSYTLDEVRQSQSLRERVRRVDVDTITFDFGSWELTENQAGALTGIAEGIRRALAQNPNEIFLIEGHTDAVGSDEDNLTLSDRRAETVATVLTQRYGIPAENLTTQGYGEQYLKVNTQTPERENRRVSLRRITPLLQGQNQQ